MAEIKTIYKGESISLLFTFPEAYDMARLTSQKVFVGETEFAGVKDGQTVKLQLKSSDTDRMIGNHKIVLWMNDTTLGLRKPYCGDLVVAKTQAAGSTVSVSDISDIIIPIAVSETVVTVGDILYNYMKGDSAYQVWLDAGNTGTVEDYLAYIQQPATDAAGSIALLEGEIEGEEALRVTAETTRVQNEQGRVTAENTRQQNETARVDAENDRDEAEALRVTAEGLRQTNTATAIQNANNAATNANTKAGLADTAANNANAKAGLADTAANNANTKAGLADTAANNANAKAGLADTAANNANTKAGLADAAATNANNVANGYAAELALKAVQMNKIIYQEDALFWLNGTIVNIDGLNYFKDILGNRDFLINEYDFDETWNNGFPYKSNATISAPAGDTALIAADINNYLYATDGTPNQIHVISLFQDVDYEHKLFCRHISQTLDVNGVEVTEANIVDIVLYSTIKTSADLTVCNNYFGVQAELTSNVKWVSKTGNDTTGDGSKSTPYLTIQKALNVAVTGDTIYVKSGVYTEQYNSSNLYLYVNKTGTYIITGLGLNVLKSVNTTRVVYNINGSQIWNNFHFDAENNTSYIIQAGASGTKTTTYNRCKFIGATQYLYIGNLVETCVIDNSLIIGDINVTTTQELYGAITELKSSYIKNAEFKTANVTNVLFKNNRIPSCTKNSVIQSSNANITILGNKMTFSQYGIFSNTNATEKSFIIAYNSFNQGDNGYKGAVYLSQAVNANIHHNTFTSNVASITGTQYFVNIQPNTTLPPTVEYNSFRSITTGALKHITLLASVPVGAAKVRFNYHESASLSREVISLNNEELTNGVWDGSQIIGNRIVCYKKNNPTGTASTHAMLLNGGQNMTIAYNYVSHSFWGIVVKTGTMNPYTSGGVFCNIVEECTHGIWIGRISAINVFRNVVKHSNVVYTNIFESCIYAKLYDTNQYAENVICKYNIFNVQLNVGSLVIFDQHAALNGSVISDSIEYGGLNKITAGSTSYATLSLAQAAGWYANSREAQPYLPSYIAKAAISGNADELMAMAVINQQIFEMTL